MTSHSTGSNGPDDFFSVKVGRYRSGERPTGRWFVTATLPGSRELSVYSDECAEPERVAEMLRFMADTVLECHRRSQSEA